MKKIIIYLISLLVFTGCMSGQNRMMNNENTIGLAGGILGGVGSALLTKNMSGTNKALIIAGSTLGGYWLSSKLGKAFDDRDKKYNKQLITKVLNENQNFETGQIKYSKIIQDPNTGVQQNHQVTQSVTPQNTYQYQNQNSKLSSNDSWKSHYYNQLNQVRNNPNTQVAQSGNICRDITVDIEIAGLTNTPQSTQFYSYCKTESGWRSLN